MPRIRDNMRDCAIYIYPSVAAARAGQQAGGGGFLVGIQSKTDHERWYPYAVTNRRVIAGGAAVVRLATKAGVTEIIELTPDDWVFHPAGDDLAAAAIELPSDYADHMLVDNYLMFLTRDEMLEERIGLGDDVFTVGRLIDHTGRQLNSPTVRFGQIAMMPSQPILIGDRAQECFLVDVRSMDGLIGSPVFVTVHQLRLPNPVEFNHAWFPFLLGVNGGLITTGIGEADTTLDGAHSAPLRSATRQSVPAPSTSGLMAVLPAWRLMELLNAPRFFNARMEMDAPNSGSGAVRRREAVALR